VESGTWKVDLHNSDAVQAAIGVARAFEAALRAYRPRPFPVRSMIIATVKRWRNRFSVRKVFGQQVHVLLIQGGHGEILSADNRQFARAVRICIAHVASIATKYQARLARGGVPTKPTARARPKKRAANVGESV